MREVALLVPAKAVEDVLDRLLPMVPGGVQEIPAGRHVELRMRGAELPPTATLKRAAGRWTLKLTEREVSEDWHERRLADYQPDVIGGRLVVRPDWAPAPAAELIDIVLPSAEAFGSGTHPTTRACLGLLLDQPVTGSFADLGCGTGVLAILAARLGFDPVLARDYNPDSVNSARANAAANGIAIEVEVADLTQEPPPAADCFAANVPASLHGVIAVALPEAGEGFGIVSGFGRREADEVFGAYGARGLAVAVRIDQHGWVAAVVRRDLP